MKVTRLSIIAALLAATVTGSRLLVEPRSPGLRAPLRLIPTTLHLAAR
jgi:hypothetical protein